MRTQTLLDEATAAPPRPQRQALEPFDVFVVEEHVAHGDDALIDLVGVACQDDALSDDAVKGWREGGSSGDEFEGGYRRVGWSGLDVRVDCGVERRGALEVQDRNVAPGDGSDEGCDCRSTGVEIAVELVDVVGRVACLGEELSYVS